MPSNEGRRYGGGSHIDACLSRIAAYEEMLHSLVAHDADNVLRQKEEVESRSDSMPLAGLALGVKDIIDAASYPTVCGSPIYEGVMPRCDAASVAQLREAGVIVMGKTVTTEFAFFSPERTRNPHDGARTPGGSSSGSAAAVAAGFIDVGLGSQTAGSITRPAWPAAVGEAPSGLAATGDPVFSRLWTLLRLPTITLPGFTGTSGMPVGVQLLAAMQEDERLLSHALWAEALFPDRPEPDLEGLLG